MTLGSLEGRLVDPGWVRVDADRAIGRPDSDLATLGIPVGAHEATRPQSDGVAPMVTHREGRRLLSYRRLYLFWELSNLLCVVMGSENAAEDCQ